MPRNTPNQPRNNYTKIKGFYEKQKAVNNFESDTYINLMGELKNDVGDAGWSSLDDDRKKQLLKKFNSSINQKFIDFGGITANSYGQGMIDNLRREIGGDEIEKLIQDPINSTYGIFQEIGQKYWGNAFRNGVYHFFTDNQLEEVKRELKGVLEIDPTKVEKKDIGSLVARYMSQRESLRNYI
ncbi:MAG: hypothetical protein PHV16_02385 [Candidatus Nanoarchaeia archaeon]|nr:hypothetical protein [Candidatus Nanoarchaeia archaeon]